MWVSEGLGCGLGGGWVLLGLCLPQGCCVLSDCRLTVDEHIWFYGRLKGLSAAAVRPEQARLLQDVGLVPKSGAQARHLSGEPSPGRSLRGGRDEAGGGEWSRYPKGGVRPEETPIWGTQRVGKGA